MKSYKKQSKKTRKHKKTRTQQKGGNNQPSFQGLPLRYYYDLNDYKADPNNASVNSRLSGGKKHKYNKTPRQRGGFIGFSNSPFLGNASFNIPASFGNIPFAYISQNVQAGSITPQNPQNPSTTDHPAEAKYNYNNPPLA